MFTVLLYHKTDWEALQRYQFVFSNYQLDHQVACCEWQDGLGAAAVVEKINFLTRNRYEWKLLIYGGQISGSLEDCIGIKDPELIRLIEIYAGKEPSRSFPAASGEKLCQPVEGFLPIHIWYVGYREKRDYEAQSYGYSAAQPLQDVDPERRFGITFRMLWFEVDRSTQMQEKYDFFRLVCGLLVLAINSIPGPYLECGYLYQLDVDMDRRAFAEYVMRLKTHLHYIKEQAMTATQDLEADYLRQMAYPGLYLNKPNLDQKRRELDGDGQWTKITQQDLSNISSLEVKLQGNRRWIRSRLYFPKGILKQELGRMQDQMDKASGISGLLNDAARDRADREQQAIIDKMRLRQEDEILWEKFPENLEKSEEQLREVKEHWHWGREKFVACGVLGFIEAVLLSPLVHHLFQKLVNNVWILLLGTMFIFPLLLWGLFNMITKYKFHKAIEEYHSLLDKRIRKVQEAGIRYMGDIVDMIGQYQYVLRLKTEDKQYQDLLRYRKELLERHQWLRESAETTCRQLESLLGDEEKTPEEHARPWVDFSANPREVEYYWVPHRRKKSMAELNHAGDSVNVFFNFISGITLKKTLQQNENKDG